MRIPSRRMPKIPERPVISSKSMKLIGLCLFLLPPAIALSHGISVIFWTSTIVLYLFSVVAISSEKSEQALKRHMIELAQSRPNESICTFAHQMDYRKIDTWVIRAVYEELQSYLNYAYPKFPLHLSDSFVRDLEIDGEDIIDIANDIATRTGRSFTLKDCEANPYRERVNTVGDLILFFNAQPRQAAATA
jgi:hypothetical protein